MRTNRFFCVIALAFVFLGAIVSQDGPSDRRVINLPRGAGTHLPFSDAILVGNTLYLSGRIGVDVNTLKPPADPKDEAKLLLESFKAVLAQANMTTDHLVHVQVFCTDLSLYSTFNEVYCSYFSKDFPARAFIGSGPLLFGGRFEMQGIAVR